MQKGLKNGQLIYVNGWNPIPAILGDYKKHPL